jgi:cell division protein ZapA
MGQVSVTLNGRTYRLECDEGEEAHLIELAEYLSSHVETMKFKFGQVGDDRLILMAALMVADELTEARRQLDEMKTLLAEQRRDRSAADESSKTMRTDLAEAIGKAADRVETLTRRLWSPTFGAHLRCRAPGIYAPTAIAASLPLSPIRPSWVIDGQSRLGIGGRVCEFCFSVTWSAVPAATPSSRRCRNCAPATPQTSSPSTARTPPAVSASPSRFWSSCSTPAPTW